MYKGKYTHTCINMHFATWKKYENSVLISVWPCSRSHWVNLQHLNATNACEAAAQSLNSLLLLKTCSRKLNCSSIGWKHKTWENYRGSFFFYFIFFYYSMFLHILSCVRFSYEVGQHFIHLLLLRLLCQIVEQIEAPPVKTFKCL